MNIEIERGFNGTYLTIKDEAFDIADDELCMFLNNKIPGFIKASCRIVNDIECIYYDISNMMSLSDLAKRQEFKAKEIKEVIRGLILAEASIEEYLLTDSGIILMPEYVFYDTHERKIKFCFYPFYSRSISESLNEMSEFLLRATDHSDKKAVKVVYALYSQIQNGDYDFSRLMHIMQDNPVGRMTENLSRHITTQIERKYVSADKKYVYKPEKHRTASRLPIVLLIIAMAAALTVMLVIAVVCLDL